MINCIFSVISFFPFSHSGYFLFVQTKDSGILTLLLSITNIISQTFNIGAFYNVPKVLSAESKYPSDNPIFRTIKKTTTKIKYMAQL